MRWAHEYDSSRNGTAPQFAYVWQPILKLGRNIVSDRVYGTKRDAMSYAVNALTSIGGSSATSLARKIQQLAPDNPDSIDLSEGDYSLNLKRLILYQTPIPSRR